MADGPREEQQQYDIVDEEGKAADSDEDAIDTLLQSAHDEPELQEDERKRVTWSCKFSNPEKKASRDLFPLAKKVG